MGLNETIVSLILALQAFYGVQKAPAPTLDWQVKQAWVQSDQAFVFEATSTKVVDECRANPQSYLNAPFVISGIQSVFADGKLVTRTSHSFKEYRSHASYINLHCSEILEAKSVTWRVDSSAAAYARIPFFPYVSESKDLVGPLTETSNLIGVGGALFLCLFSLIAFWNMDKRGVVWCLSLSSLFSSIYFGGITVGILGILIDIHISHKIGLLSISIGAQFLYWAYYYEGLLSKRLLIFTNVVTVLGSLAMAFGISADMVQLASYVCFTPFYIISAFLLWEIVRPSRKWDSKWRQLAHVASIVVMFVGGLIEGVVAVGTVYLPLFGPLMQLGGILFFVLALNIEIRTAYEERNHLRRNLEKEVIRKTKELETKTAELNQTLVTLKETQAELVQNAKLASIGRLSAGLSHELNNSLNYANGSVVGLRGLLNEICPPERKDDAEKILSILQKGLDLTIDIVKNLRSHAGLNRAQMNEVRVIESVSTATTMLKSKLDRITLSVDVDQGITLYGSVVGLNQVIMNLISNAVDSMPNGGQLNVSAKQLFEYVSGKTIEFVEIEVSDTGSGMTEEVKEKIFEPFFTTKPIGKGTGLGLHFVKNEIDRHMGKIAVKSEIGKGTHFYIRIPADYRQLQTAPRAANG